MNEELEVLDFDDPDEFEDETQPYQPNQALRPLVDELQNTMKRRIQWGNRLAAIYNGTDRVINPTYLNYYQHLFARAQEDEDKIREIIKYEVSQFEIFDYMEKVKGLGSNISAYLISMIDITIPKTPSALWRYSGYGVSWYYQDGEGKIVAPQQGYQFEKTKNLDGTETKIKVQRIPEPRPDWNLVQARDRPVTGWLLPYNKRLKTHLYNLGRSFLKSNSPYRVIYDLAKEQYLQRGLTQKTNNEKVTWNKAHADMAGQRKMLKVFLCHFWLTWRIIENLPVTNLYVHDRLGHRDIYFASQFGWPDIGQDNALKALPMPKGYKRPEDLKHKKVRPVKLPFLDLETREVDEVEVELDDNLVDEVEQDQAEVIVGTPVEDLQLLVRTFNILKRNKFDTIEQVLDDLKKGGHKIRMLYGMGVDSFHDLYSKLLGAGYTDLIPEKSEEDDSY